MAESYFGKDAAVTRAELVPTENVDARSAIARRSSSPSTIRDFIFAGVPNAGCNSKARDLRSKNSPTRSIRKIIVPATKSPRTKRRTPVSSKTLRVLSERKVPCWMSAAVTWIVPRIRKAKWLGDIRGGYSTLTRNRKPDLPTFRRAVTGDRFWRSSFRCDPLQSRHRTPTESAGRACSLPRSFESGRNRFCRRA